jgi:hypothetical protein
MYLVTNRTNSDIRLGNAILAASEAATFTVLPGEVKGFIANGSITVTQFTDSAFAIKSNVLTRPTDTNAYAAGDALASAAGGFFSFVNPAPGRGLRIERARIRKSAASVTNAAFRLYLFDTLPVLSVADNAALQSAGILGVASVTGLVGRIDIAQTAFFGGTAYAVGTGVPAVGSAITFSPSDTYNFYAIAEVNGAYVPANAETFDVTLEGTWAA